MKRRAFIALLGGARRRGRSRRGRSNRVNARRIGVLTGGYDPVASTPRGIPAGARTIGLDRSAATCGIDIRWAVSDADAIRRYATELVALAPDVIMAVAARNGRVAVRRPTRCRSCSRSCPIRSAPASSKPVAAGRQRHRLHAYSNISLSGKWLELLKEIRPGLTRVAVLRDSIVPAGIGQLAVIQSLATTLDVELSPIDAQNAAQIERDITAFARSSDGGLIVASSTGALVNRALIVALAARHKLPAIYSQREFVTDGGLMSYSADFTDQFRRAAGYVDRILKGEKAADLPVQAPTKYELRST